MERIVVAAKARAEQPWLADAAASLAKQTGAEVAVVSLDGIELEALSTIPRSAVADDVRRTAEEVAARIRDAGAQATAEGRSGPVVKGVLLYAEEREADLIMVGATSRGPVATRMLGTTATRLVERSRRPVLVVTPPLPGEPA